jgi:hypothetical protein
MLARNVAEALAAASACSLISVLVTSTGTMLSPAFDVTI